VGNDSRFSTSASSMHLLSPIFFSPTGKTCGERLNYDQCPCDLFWVSPIWMWSQRQWEKEMAKANRWAAWSPFPLGPFCWGVCREQRNCLRVFILATSQGCVSVLDSSETLFLSWCGKNKQDSRECH
jgi:hypothetical protein